MAALRLATFESFMDDTGLLAAAACGAVDARDIHPPGVAVRIEFGRLLIPAH